MEPGVWSQISSAMASEFSDLPNAAELTRLLLRLSMAALLGGLLGMEREHKGKAAGVRTHMLVSMGAALFVLLASQGGMKDAELSRVLQGVIAGIGFLGAGTILKAEHEDKVRGLTTAAGIWLTAAIGVAAGLGRESTAVLSTLLALGVLALVPMLVRDVEPSAGGQPGKGDGGAAPTRNPAQPDSPAGSPVSSAARARAPHPARAPGRRP